MKKFFLTVLIIFLLATATVYAQSSITSAEMEGRTYQEVFQMAVDRGLLFNNRVSGRTREEVEANRVALIEARRAFRLELAAHFIPNYSPGNIVDADLIGEDGRPIEGYTFASIQSQQTEHLPIGEGFNWGHFDEWLYAYQGMTTLERAVFDRINEVRAEYNLHPLVHDPLLSVGARYRTAYFQRVLPRDVAIHHRSGTFTTDNAVTVFNPIGGGSGGAILLPTRTIFLSDSYTDLAYSWVRSWLNSTAGHREAVLAPHGTRMGVGIADVNHRNPRGEGVVTTYVFLG